jgi:hypothetical protein
MAMVTAASPLVETAATISAKPAAMTHADTPANLDIPIVRKKGKAHGHLCSQEKTPYV